MTAHAYRDNTAVQINKEAVSAQQIKSIQGRKTEKAKVPYVKYGMIAMCVFAVLATVVFFNMQVAELTAQNGELKAQLSELKDQEQFLNAKKERMYNLSYVEEYAKNVLGMVKLDKADINYVELSGEEKVSAAAPEQNDSQLLAGISRTFNVVLEYLN
ncbi:MAG: septum formation initiator family protein [Clostridia bacterium]|nr:septum formation initiator family protein [Clostridia bacterium]MBR4955612.1 septum formation initiator family protein [Clostridia bacterium]